MKLRQLNLFCSLFNLQNFFGFSHRAHFLNDIFDLC